MLGTPINFYGARPRIAWRLFGAPLPPYPSLPPTAVVFPAKPAESSRCAEKARTVGTYLQRRPTCVARSCQPAAFRYAALCQFLSNTRAEPRSKTTKIKNKTKAGTVGHGSVWYFLLGFCLFMRTFCAGQRFISFVSYLYGVLFTYLPTSHTHTHTYRHTQGLTHTLNAHLHLVPRSSAHLSAVRLVLA